MDMHMASHAARSRISGGHSVNALLSYLLPYLLPQGDSTNTARNGLRTVRLPYTLPSGGLT